MRKDQLKDLKDILEWTEDIRESVGQIEKRIEEILANRPKKPAKIIMHLPRDYYENGVRKWKEWEDEGREG